MTTSIYILRLQSGRYYVGKTENVIQRYQEHLAGQGSAWTRKYPPLSLERSFPMTSPFDEDKYTKEYMAEYGIDKVRGGAYVSEVLAPSQLENLRREIRAATDKCVKCGLEGHYAEQCTFIAAVPAIIPRSTIVLDPPPPPKPKAPLTCFRCGRRGHFANTCFAKTTIKGDLIKN